MPKYICTTSIFEGGKRYKAGDKIELDESRAKSLGAGVVVLDKNDKAGEKIKAKDAPDNNKALTSPTKSKGKN